MENSILERFIYFEHSNNLFNYEVGKFKFWGYLRCEIYTKILQKSNSIESSTNIQQNRLIIFNTLKFLLLGLLKSPFKVHKICDILFFSSGQANLCENKYICRFTDLIIDEFEKKARIVCISDTNVSNRNRYRNVKYNFDIIQLPPKILYKFFLIICCDKEYIISLSNKISLMIYHEFNVHIDSKYLTKLIYKTWFCYKYIYRKSFKLLKRTRPRCIIYQQYYSLEHMCINEVSKKLGIDTIELQHGVIGKGHVAYNYFSKQNFSFMPKKIFFWGDYWKSSCKMPIDESNKIVCGFPYYDKQVRNYPPVNNHNNIYRILVLSQNTVTQKFISIFENLINMFDNNNIHYNLIYKLHPLELNSNMKIFDQIKRNKNVEFIDNLNISLYKLFANSDIQISETSTALFEGIQYNLNTYIYDSKLSRLYMKILEKEYNAKFFNNAIDLFYLILNGKKLSSKYNTNIFFKNNSLANIKNELINYI